MLDMRQTILVVALLDQMAVFVALLHQMVLLDVLSHHMVLLDVPSRVTSVVSQWEACLWQDAGCGS